MFKCIYQRSIGLYYITTVKRELKLFAVHLAITALFPFLYFWNVTHTVLLLTSNCQWCVLLAGQMSVNSLVN